MKTVAEVVQEEKQKFLGELKEGTIRQQVVDMLKTSLTNTVLSILGFELRWNGGKPTFQIDHCNGRAGNSLIGNMIKEEAAEACKILLKPGTFTLTAEELNAVRAAVHKNYLDNYRMMAAKIAGETGKAHAKQYMEKEVAKALEGDAELVKLRLME